MHGLGGWGSASGPYIQAADLPRVPGSPSGPAVTEPIVQRGGGTVGGTQFVTRGPQASSPLGSSAAPTVCPGGGGVAGLVVLGACAAAGALAAWVLAGGPPPPGGALRLRAPL